MSAFSARPFRHAATSGSGIATVSGTGTIWFVLTTLLGAFLVFQVQPVISKCVLPWFGGTPAVWTTCMLFFQTLLFGGYLYAHLIRVWFSPRVQAAIHLMLLGCAAWSLPIEPSKAWEPSGSESPVWYLLVLLAVHVGLPYFVLSATGPLVQAWLSYRDDHERVYRLYAVSNFGSLAALLSYPFVVEPLLSVSSQSTVWSLLFLGFVLVQGAVAVGLLRLSWRPREGVEDDSRGEAWPGGGNGVGRRERDPSEESATGRGVMAAWLLLPALASIVLLTVTNHVCQDIAVIPFLWILPLSLYLVSFIVCFDSPRHYRPKVYAAVTLLSLGVIQGRDFLPPSPRLIAEAVGCMVMLFGVCMLCHGEVARLKPGVRRLTQFYAFVSAGGALGGIIVAIVCPLVFDRFTEWPLAISVVTAISFVLLFVCRGWGRSTYDWSAAHRLRIPAMTLAVVPTVVAFAFPKDELVMSDRNFFGVLQVTRGEEGLRLVHGKTIHGIQRAGDASREPTSYYGRESGIGRAIRVMREAEPRSRDTGLGKQGGERELRVGVVGLGCGVLATYGRDGDRFDMIEINPSVVSIADRHFSFLRDSRAEIRHHLGDGRLVLERMRDARFDLLVLDAFSSDAIPAHLLTREAVGLYRERIGPGGVIAFHLSNNHLELCPLVQRLVAEQGMEGRMVRSRGDESLATESADWVLAAEPGHPMWDHPLLDVATEASEETLREAPLWTDRNHNLAGVLRLW